MKLYSISYSIKIEPFWGSRPKGSESNLLSQSTLKTPVRILLSKLGGRTQGIIGPSRLESDESLQNPWNFPLSFTEKIKITFVACWNEKRLKINISWIINKLGTSEKHFHDTILQHLQDYNLASKITIYGINILGAFKKHLHNKIFPHITTCFHFGQWPDRF